ncbi:MAG: extracellular solute-binding protein [Oscillospiraceae bacterium]|nr:extracellular solute-binding protein [Oscillospiraceae bacterium]
MYINPSQKKKLYAGIAVAVLAVIVIFALTRGGVSSYRHKYEGFDLTAPASGRTNTYARYLNNHEGAALPSDGVVIDVASFEKGTSSGATVENYEGFSNVLMTTDESVVEYKVNVPKAGFYNLKLDYFPVPKRGIDIERAVYINGELPFLGADIITFYRIWSDAPGGIKKDNQGNQIRPSQVETPRWESAFFMDSQGYSTEPYKFYFEAGENTITLSAVNEPAAIKSFEITPVRELRSYKEYITDYSHLSYNLNEPIKIQGEDSTFRSSPSLYAFFDTSSGTTEPYSVEKIILNAIGGERWRVPGQWIEWEVEVPADGLYRISVKARQNYNRGIVSNRSLVINGEIPCKEALSIPFFYNNQWQLISPVDEDGNELYFPLKAGKNSIRLQVTLGDLSTVLAQIEESIFRLNEIYRQILVQTGANPDPYRDYRLDEHYPEIFDRMDFESKYLYKIIDDLIEYSGQMGPEVASLQTIARQLETFCKRPNQIAKNVVNFKENIAAVGNSLVGLNSSPLDVDWLTASTDGNKLPSVSENIFVTILHEIRSFIATFFIDYNNIGDKHEKGANVTEVWIFSGRDQSTILKTMIDDTYTPDTGNKVNLKLVGLEALMPAVVAGTGPDVALTVNNPDPINYAFRNAALDLSKFPGFSELASQFYPSAFVPYDYNGGIYGFPETQIFGVMFYRTDILDEMGILPPRTWEELTAIIGILQKSNMSVGISTVERKINGIPNPDLSNFLALLYQHGGSLYNEERSRCILDNDKSVQAFTTYTKFFTHYKTPLHYEFANRFRSGEMPIGFADYNTFNMLAVFAPEIRGLWKFDIMPGTVREDGTIDRSVPCWGNASMILANAKDQGKAWEFLRWWVSAETQVRFGRKLESTMGTSARHPTANREAFEQLAWNSHDARVLREQWEWVTGTPEIPGGYYSGRHIVNAVRRVINSKEDVRETLLNYNRDINNEIKKKREEFGLE